MEEKKCRCGSGHYCHEHKGYNLPPKLFEKEMRRQALLGVGGKGKKLTKITTETGG